MTNFRSSLILLPLLVLIFASCNRDCDTSPNLDVDQAQLDADILKIDAYLANNNITNAKVHPSGIRYVIKREGDGSRPKLCDDVTVTYEGRLMSNDVKFDGSQNLTSFNLEGLIVGWQIGIPLIKEGGRITLYIPSVYGYGEDGYGASIPPNANLKFEVLLF